MSERAQLLLPIADDELILGWRDSEWTGIAPFLEEDVAFSSIAQNEIGHARALYELAARELGTTADELAFDRAPEEYRCAPLVELRLVPDWARTIARHYLYETADAVRLEALKASDDPEVAGLAAKIDREEAYHRMHAQMWLDRLATRSGSRGGRRAGPYALGELAAGRLGARRALGRRSRPSSADASTSWRALGGDDDGAPLGAGGDVVTDRAGLGRARRDPRSRDPGDLARRPRRRPRRRGRGRPRARRVHADVPRLPGARGDARRDGGEGPRARRRAGDRRRPRRLVVDRPDHARGPREAARGRLRTAGAAARPARRSSSSCSEGVPLPVLRLDRHAAREHLRPDAVPVAPLLHELPAAVRAVQDDLGPAAPG